MSVDGVEDLREYGLLEFNNIVNNVSDPEFLESLKQKKFNINWIKFYKIFKTEILKEITNTWNDMWEEEKLSEKIKMMEELRNNASKNCSTNIKIQRLKLKIQYEKDIKNTYTKIAEEEEQKIIQLKQELLSKWEKIKMQQRVLEHVRQKNIDFCKSITENLQYNSDVLSKLS